MAKKATDYRWIPLLVMWILIIWGAYAEGASLPFLGIGVVLSYMVYHN